MQQEELGHKTHGSLEKGLGLLSAFIPDNREMRTVELAKFFSMNRSTVSRMLTVLKRQGFVRQNPETSKYSLGPIIANLADAYRSSFQSTLTQLARPYLDQLRNELNQTVVLEVPADDCVVVTYVTEGFGPIKISARVGDRHHYHTSAGGKCILAFSSHYVIDQILKVDLPKITSKTVVDPQSIRIELERIQKTMFAFDREGNSEGINAFAVPVFDKEGLPVATIVAAGPSNIVTWKEKQNFVKRLQNAARHICSLLTNGEAVSP